MNYAWMSPNLWLALLSFLALVGIFLEIFGMTRDNRWMMVGGAVLVAPLLLGGVAIVLVVIPLLIIANWRRKK